MVRFKNFYEAFEFTKHYVANKKRVPFNVVSLAE